MLVSEVATRVKRQFGDESGVQVTDADIIRWINDANKDICQAQEIIEAFATSTSTIGVATITLPADLVNLKGVYYNGASLKPLNSQEYDSYINDLISPPTLVGGVSVQQTQGIPEVFYVWALTVVMFPVPNASGQEIKLAYSKFPTAVTVVGDALPLPMKYDNRVIEFCLQQAYELDENFEAAGVKAEQFGGSLVAMAEDSTFTAHESYPNITTMPEDI